jgi:hypothetical protein
MLETEKILLEVDQVKENKVTSEIKKLDSQLNILIALAILFISGFVVELSLIIFGVVSFNLIDVIILAILPLGLIQSIKKGRAVNLQLFLLNMIKK